MDSYNTPEERQHLPDTPSFCTKAWSGISISPSGAIQPCCLFEEPICNDEGKPFHIWEDDVEEIFNSKYMQEVREKMLKGEKVDPCRQCYQNESAGGYSLRKISNQENYEIMPEYKVEGKHLPVSLDLKLNNKCNLKCRMCQPKDSHLIDNEFRKIIAEDKSFQNFSNVDLYDPLLKMPLNEIPEWSQNETFLKSFDKLLPSLRKISMVGGEPLIMDDFYFILDRCIEAGLAKNIYVAVTTNLMYAPKEKLDVYLEEFYSFLFNISLDATDIELNYIRNPSQFKKIEANFKKIYREDPQGLIHFQFTPTVQVYNVLYLFKVYSFVNRLLYEDYKLTWAPVHLTYLAHPVHLNIRILPKEIREMAVKRLRTCMLTLNKLKESEITMSNLEQLIHTLENDFHPESERLFQEFLYYSQALDKMRGQRLQDFLPELHELIEKLEIKPKRPIVNYFRLRDRGWELAGENKLKEAIACFKEAVRVSDEKFIDYREMGWMNLALKNFYEARICYDKGYALRPDDKNIAKGIVLAYVSLDLKKEAKEFIKNALELNPGDSELEGLNESLKKY